MLGNNYTLKIANSDDLEKIVDLHLASFTSDEHIPVLIGKQYVKASYKWLLSHKNAFILIARDNEKIIGLQSVSIGSFEIPMFIACLPALLYSMLTNPKLIINNKLWKRLIRILNRLKPGKIKTHGKFAHFIIGIVDADYRGKGIFSAVVNAAVQKCKENNCKTIFTGIYKKNVTTQRIFLKYGWKNCPEMETNETYYYCLDLASPQQ
jgi:GNAT superfamily N-acetyltransferase